MNDKKNFKKTMLMTTKNKPYLLVATKQTFPQKIEMFIFQFRFLYNKY